MQVLRLNVGVLSLTSSSGYQALAAYGVAWHLLSHAITAQSERGYQRCPERLPSGKGVNYKTGCLRSGKIIKVAQETSFS